MFAMRTARRRTSPAASAHRPREFRGLVSRQRKCAGCELEEATGDRLAPPAVHEVLATSGTPLPAQERAFFEARFGHDFSRIRVHADSIAANAAKAVAAQAFTVGRHIAFAAGRFIPGTVEGRQLLGHELAHAVQQSQSEPSGVAGLRISDAAGADERAADRAAVGRAAPGEAEVAVQRQPEQPNVGPPVQQLPLPPICSLVFKEGRVYWKCEHLPKIGSTPDIPLDPRQIPDEIDKILKKKGPPSGPTPGPVPRSGPVPVDDPGKLVEQLCQLHPELCKFPPQPPSPPQRPTLPTPGPQLGILWTDQIHFEQDHPGPGERDAGRVLTAAGQRELDSILSWLDLSPDLQVRLIGHASSEGTEEYNQALATRRVNFILAALTGRGFGPRVADPLIGDGAESGCQRVGAGLWSCGETKADQSTARPEDRVVRATFVRNTLPPLPKLEMPQFKPRPF
jgi:hypothetical protein